MACIELKFCCFPKDVAGLELNPYWICTLFFCHDIVLTVRGNHSKFKNA